MGLLDEILTVETENNKVSIEESKDLRGRFKGADWFTNKIQNIIVGGIGGIGSWFSILATRAMPTATFYLFDMDTIERHNLGGQFFDSSSIGRLKTVAIEQLIKAFSFKNVHIEGEYTKYSKTDKVMISCFDNMKARKLMFDNWRNSMNKSTNKNEYLFIDGRLLAEQYEVFFVTKENYKEYELDWLFDDSEIPDVDCTLKQTSHFAAAIAAVMVQGLTHFASNSNKAGSRELPFHIRYFGELFLTETYATHTKTHTNK